MSSETGTRIANALEQIAESLERLTGALVYKNNDIEFVGVSINSGSWLMGDDTFSTKESYRG